ncbi:MAG: class I SAM-dependent methyltransferase, partial [Alphaproteobacteria bacterium]
ARQAGVLVAAARAGALPLAARSVDVAIIFNSLHHFPDPGAALAEARRVMTADALLYIAEPLAQGAYFTFMQPVDDETVARGRALDALAAAHRRGLALETTTDYAYDVVVRDLASAIRSWIAVDPTRAARIDAVRDELARRLAAHGIVTPQGYALEQPMRSWLLRPV